MKNSVFCAIILFTIFLSGCAGTMPQTAEEFRKAVPGAFMSEVETFEIDRLFKIRNGPLNRAQFLENGGSKKIKTRIKTVLIDIFVTKLQSMFEFPHICINLYG